MAETVTLQLNHVSKSFAKVEKEGITNALGNIDLTMHDGEFISLVGTSGCGKITGPDPSRGMVFQKPTLFPWLTVEKNISFSLRMQNKFKGNEEEVERMLKVIGLEEFRDDYPGQLSGGMAQRVALVRTLINHPKILLLDEPLGALDAFTRMNMQDEILDIWKKRKQLVVMVTHDVDEAIYMGTRVIAMEANPGQIKADIPIELPYPRDRSSAEFVGYRNQILGLLNYGSGEKGE